jgi:hypothetical protein
MAGPYDAALASLIRDSPRLPVASLARGGDGGSVSSPLWGPVVVLISRETYGSVAAALGLGFPGETRAIHRGVVLARRRGKEHQNAHLEPRFFYANESLSVCFHVSLMW